MASSHYTAKLDLSTKDEKQGLIAIRVIFDIISSFFEILGISFVSEETTLEDRKSICIAPAVILWHTRRLVHGIRLYLRKTSSKSGHRKKALIRGPDSLRIVTVIVYIFLPFFGDTNVELSNSSVCKEFFLIV